VADHPDRGPGQDSAWLSCPYCGEVVEIFLDPGGGAVQSYVEDCPVCCRPWHLTVRWDTDGFPSVEARTEEE